jgi:hypothetical protein
MRQIEEHVEIEAPAETVWAVLADFAAYGEWNPFMEGIDGTLGEGERLRVQLHLPGSRPMTMKPKVIDVVPTRSLRWLGHLGVPGIFDGEHSLAIEPTATGVRFVQSERFRGVLVPFVWRWIERKTRAGFRLMNDALKARDEASDKAVRPVG